ncbi:EpsG family protein [Myroides marinus]|uniref:EpsG family protein n=1 Tax=Myroides marinus TaxID=703342 RepID=UPI00257749A3|nr:EpsG family protein [Myroides marinus]MDM1405488.1 EpsG family protein [Myroides marinus]
MNDYFLYHFVILIPMMLYFFKINNILKNRLTGISIFIVGCFLCMGYMTGSDWVNYELVYNDKTLHIFYEPAYVALMNIGYLLDLDFFVFLIIVKIICYLLIVRSLKRYSGDQFLFVFSLFISFFGLYLFIDNPLRNLIAIVIFVLSIQAFVDKNYKKYFLYLILAVSFHKSAVIAFLLPFVLLLPFKKLQRTLMILMVLFVFLGITGFFVKIFTFVIGLIPFFDKFSTSYLEEGSEYIIRESLNAKSLVFLFLFILIFIKQRIAKEKDQSLLFRFFLLYVALFVVTVFVPIFDRFTFYYATFFVVILGRQAYNFKLTSRFNYYVLLILLVIINTHTMIMNKYVYLPYTNYLSYAFKEKPSFNYRVNYNHKHSPATNRNK